MLITVFTPIYNRAHLLSRVYESLCKQTFKDFEWVIVDDGSTDESFSVVQRWTNDSSPKGKAGRGFFPIRYIYQENGGKHRAINCGVKEARGELFFIVDSDDMLPPDALEIVVKVYEDIRDNQSFAGVCGLDGTFEGKVIGSGLPASVIDDTSIAVRFRLGVTGDMKEVFRTSVLQEFPFPEIDGERFCPEMLVWNRIATKYKLRYFNRVIYLAEYQADGLTSDIVKARMKSPAASMMTYAELTEYRVPMREKVKAAINYWRFRCCVAPSPPSLIGKAFVPKLVWWLNWVMPVGLVMHMRDVH